MSLTEEQLKALDDHIAALQAWRDDPGVELQWRYKEDEEWEDLSDQYEPPIRTDGTIENSWFRLKPTPQTRPMTWEEVPLEEIEWVRKIGDERAYCFAEWDGMNFRCGFEKWFCSGNFLDWEYTTDRNPRNATWKRFEVTE